MSAESRCAGRAKSLILNGGQGRDRTAAAGFSGPLAMELSGVESADIIETIRVAASSI
jgi:hypothetical protein